MEIRRNAKRLVERLGRGESFGIIYGNRTVGELFPPKSSTEIRADDPLCRIAEPAEDLGGGLDARETDRIVYGRCNRFSSTRRAGTACSIAVRQDTAKPPF